MKLAGKFLWFELFKHFIDTFVFSANIAAIAKPSVCSQTMDVFNKAGAYEKNLCYIRTKATYFQAQAFCQKSGMKLYQVQSSATAATKLQDYAKSVLNGNRNAFVFVEGINGTECLAYDGYGRKRYLLCSTPTFFVCQFYITGKFLRYMQSLKLNRVLKT